ncbi:hypothetical protein, partial [Enterococcus faecalis]|uniref:hypothetical protein n=1 Tax=Enterococcus faecalis TaxID=1351 RepID=UPI001C6582FF
VVKLVMRKSSYKISVVVTLILQNGLSFYLPKISIYTKYFTLSQNYERNKKDTQISDYNNNYHKKIKFSV